MPNVFDGDQPRVGFVRVPGRPAEEVVPCTVALGPRGPVAYFPHDADVPWTAPVAHWHQQQRVPPTLYFHDNFGDIVLVDTRWTQMSGSRHDHGRVRIEALVTLMGDPVQQPQEVEVAEVHSRFDGLVDFAGRRAVDLDRQLDDQGRPGYIIKIAPDERTTWSSGKFEVSIRASSDWHAVGDDDFTTESQAWVITKTSNGASVLEHLRLQRRVRALVMFAEGRGLYWREHRVSDDLFPEHTERQWVEAFVRGVYRERSLEPQKENIFKLFRLEHLDETTLARWLELCEDPALMRAIEPFTDNLIERPSFIEINVMTRAMTLDAIGHYWHEKPERSKHTNETVEECIRKSGIDVTPIGSVKRVATAISNLYNDVKHVARPRPDAVGLSLADDLLEVLIRAQLFALLGLPDDLRDQFTDSWAVRRVFQSFADNRLVLAGSGKEVRFVQQS